MDSFKLKNQRVKHILPIGHSQGNLTVVSEVYSVRKSTLSTQRCVDCLCKCGNTVQVSVSRLASGKAKSCGCLSRAALERDVSKYEAGLRAVLRVYEYSAKERGLEFNLSRETFEHLTASNCTYCGVEPLQFQNRFSEFKYNGIDRVDNTKGYVIENCVPCCKTCNRMKDTLSLDEFKSHIAKVVLYQKEIKSCQNP